MGRKVLDRNRYYALVYGDADVKYYQDGVFFRGNGTAVSTSAPQEVPTQTADEVAETDDRVAKLKDMHVAKIKQLAKTVAEQTGTEAPPMKGAGLKAKLIDYILANTE